MSDIIQTLAEYFLKFPGIGKRQSLRFVHFLLRQDPVYIDKLTDALQALKSDIVTCTACNRFFAGGNTKAVVCPTCSDTKRDDSLLMVVEKDIDHQNIESSGAYKGYYYILGATVPVLAEEPTKHLELTGLKKRIKELKPKEIILALNATPEGENTAHYVRDVLKNIKGVKVSILGRGLSTGTELEYSDEETIRNAFNSRT